MVAMTRWLTLSFSLVVRQWEDKKVSLEESPVVRFSRVKRKYTKKDEGTFFMEMFK
jgi:hypothetical protein